MPFFRGYPGNASQLNYDRGFVGWAERRGPMFSQTQGIPASSTKKYRLPMKGTGGSNYVASVAETVSLVESLLSELDAFASLNETVAISEALTALYAVNAALSESVSLSAVVVAGYSAIATISETVTQSEALATQATMASTLSETAALSEALAVRLDATQLLEDQPQWIERLDVRYAITLSLPVGIGWFANVDGYSLKQSTVRVLGSGELPLRGSGASLVPYVAPRPIKKLKGGT